MKYPKSRMYFTNYWLGCAIENERYIYNVFGKVRMSNFSGAVEIFFSAKDVL